MQRSKSGSNWIVQKLIERDHMNHHYRRLNEVHSQLHLNNRNPPISRNRLSKSSNDVRFEDQLRGIERTMASQFCLDVTIPVSDKKKEISDETLDVMTRHSKYFTQPKKQFTPRVVRKFVRPKSSPPNRPQSSTRSLVFETPIIKVPSTSTPRKPKKVFFPLDPQRNVSDDSAFGDEQESSSSSTSDSQETAAFNIKKWLKEQEEENVYLELLLEVTADLLQRNLCTNGNMKEILAIYIRKSKRKFSVCTSVLMKRLCDDLMIPSDNSFDDQNYGSRYTTSFSYQSRRDQREDFRNILKEIEPSDNSHNNHNDVPSQRNNRYELTKHSSLPKANNFDLDDVEHDWLQDEHYDLKNDNHVTKCTSSQHVPIISGKKTDTEKVQVDMEGYFSDFTNDTENDIEEEFDFD